MVRILLTLVVLIVGCSGCSEQNRYDEDTWAKSDWPEPKHGDRVLGNYVIAKPAHQ